MTRLLMALLLLALQAPQAAAGLRSLKMVEPRPFGYFAGDIIERRAIIAVDADSELLRASLPSAGPLSYWLDLIRVDLEESSSAGGKLYRVTLVYQTFYVPFDPRKLTVPARPVAGGDGGFRRRDHRIAGVARVASGVAAIPAAAGTAIHQGGAAHGADTARRRRLPAGAGAVAPGV
jgi:hypothetical protein